MTVAAVRRVTPLVTIRQVEVIQLIAEGLANKEIAGRLGITANNVERHCFAIRRRLDVAARRQIPLRFMTLTGIDPYPRLPSNTNDERGLILDGSSAPLVEEVSLRA